MMTSARPTNSAGVAATVAPATALALSGCAIPHRDLVPDLDQPRRDGRAHFPDTGDTDTHPHLLGVVPGRGPLPASPEPITTGREDQHSATCSARSVFMDSGLTLRVPRNDGNEKAACAGVERVS